MKRSVQRVVASGALLSGWASGSLVQAERVAEPDMSVMLSRTFEPQQVAIFNDVKRHMVSRMGSLAGVDLVLLERDESSVCNGLPVTRVDGPQYCSREDAVIMGAAGYDMAEIDLATDTDASKKALAQYVMSHELAHAIQYKQKEALPKFNDDSFEDNQRFEQQADCYAGQVVAAYDPGSVTEVQRIISNFSSEVVDPLHGSPQERLDSFLAGANQQPC